MRDKATLSSQEDDIQRQKSALQGAFCRARIQQATRVQRTLRLQLKQVEKRSLLLAGQA